MTQTKLTIIHGTTSSGKTTLARKLADDTGALLLDDFHLRIEEDTVLVIAGNYDVQVIETRADTYTRVQESSEWPPPPNRDEDDFEGTGTR